MRPIGYALNLEWLKLIIILLLGTLINGNFGSLDLLEASSFTSDSRKIEINHPMPQPSNLINPNLGEGVLEIPIRKRFRNHESNTGSLKLARFDLNELPEDTGSELSHKHDEEISELGSYRDHGQTSNSQPIESAHQSTTDSKPSSVDTSHVSTESASDQDRSINELELLRDTRDFYTYQVSKSKPGRRYDQKDKIKHSSKSSKEKVSRSSEKSSNKYVAQNRERKNPDEEDEEDLSMDSEVIGKNKIKIFLKEKTNYITKKTISSSYLEYFEWALTAEVKIPGPFDIQGEKMYRSPYNRELLVFIQKNLKKILPSELSKHQITEHFLSTIKSYFWNKRKGLFFISEGRFREAIISVDSESHGSLSKTWILTKSSGTTSSINKFCFIAAFTKFLEYDKLSRFFLNDEMRKTANERFLELNSKLLELKRSGVKLRRGVITYILKQTWYRMTGFLAYVHAFNAIISPDHSEPISYQKLVELQQNAIDFFFNLHDNVEILCSKKRDMKLQRVTPSPVNIYDYNFEEEKLKLMKLIFSSNLRVDNVPWLYIELWMMKRRPSLYTMLKDPVNGESKPKVSNDMK
ncbi:hypothetical protein BY996DRAFT_6413406 [Phakopsora pachyrhizi]|nr:hypothetical protein BY996DRAFT_6413406 [Phakopsora pachyrhizi]